MQLALAKVGDYNGQRFNVQRDVKQVVKRKRAKREQDPDWALDPEVQEELQAMGGVVKKDYELRSQGGY